MSRGHAASKPKPTASRPAPAKASVPGSSAEGAGGA